METQQGQAQSRAHMAEGQRMGLLDVAVKVSLGNLKSQSCCGLRGRLYVVRCLLYRVRPTFTLPFSGEVDWNENASIAGGIWCD